MISHPVLIQHLKECLEKGESEQIEFKEAFHDDALETIGAMSNAGGGSLFIGVTDKGHVCGFQIGKKTLEDIAHRIQEATEPRLQPSLSLLNYEAKQVILIQVARGSGMPISVRGRYYRRSGKSNQRMSHEEIMQRMISSSGLSWDALPEPGTTYEDLDPQFISQFIQSAQIYGRRALPSHMSELEYLRKLDLIRDQVPTRAALLLFGKNPQAYFPSAFLKMGRFRSSTHIVDDRESRGSLIKQLEEADSWIRERLATELIIEGKPERTIRWEYPLNAIREAMINMLCHRDYTSPAHSQIRLYDHRLEFWNAGHLPAPLTPEALLTEHDSIPRNRKIADVFYYMGYIERWGSGTLRILEALEQAQLPKPNFISEQGHFKLILTKEAEVSTIPSLQILSSRERMVLEYLHTHGYIRNNDYQDITGVSKRTASRDLIAMKNKGLLELEGTTGRGTFYRLKKGAIKGTKGS